MFEIGPNLLEHVPPTPTPTSTPTSIPDTPPPQPTVAATTPLAAPHVTVTFITPTTNSAIVTTRGLTDSPRISSSPPPITTNVVSPPTLTTYIVKSGDILTIIAERYGVSVEAIIEANKLQNANEIVVGQELIIPNSEENE